MATAVDGLAVRAWRPAVAAAVAAVLLAGPAQAYRPFDLTDADVASRHHFEIELGPAEFVGVGSEHSLRAPSLSINYGLATGRELVLEGANRLALESTPGEPRASLEDVALAMKQVLRRGGLQDEAGPSLALESAILLPERGEKHLGAGATLIVSSVSKAGTAHFDLEAERLPESRSAGAAGVIFEASDHYGLAPAIELRLGVVDGGPPEPSVILGLIYVPGAETEYDLAIRLARNGEERILELRAGLTWQVSAHRVLEKVRQAAGLPAKHPRRRH